MVRSGAIWGVRKYVITNLKINNFKEKNQQENLIAILPSQINLHKHVSAKINILRIYQGVGGGAGGLAPSKAEEISKKIKQNGGSSFFLLFGKAPYIPKIMGFLPSSPKIITSAPQLHGNK